MLDATYMLCMHAEAVEDGDTVSQPPEEASDAADPATGAACVILNLLYEPQ